MTSFFAPWAMPRTCRYFAGLEMLNDFESWTVDSALMGK